MIALYSFLSSVFSQFNVCYLSTTETESTCEYTTGKIGPLSSFRNILEYCRKVLESPISIVWKYFPWYGNAQEILCEYSGNKTSILCFLVYIFNRRFQKFAPQKQIRYALVGPLISREH